MEPHIQAKLVLVLPGQCFGPSYVPIFHHELLFMVVLVRGHLVNGRHELTHKFT